MAVKGQENLVPQSKRTKDEQRKIATMGGVASGKARRDKKNIRLAVEALLEKDYKGKDGKILSGAEAITVKQMEKALKGDTKAFEVLRDSAGQKPIERVMVAEVDQTVIDEIEREILCDE